MERKKITTLSQELYKESIMTFPIPIIHAGISLTYERTETPGLARASDEEYAAYIARCVENKVIPHSYISFAYDETRDSFSVNNHSGTGIEGRLDKIMLDLIVKGGKFENVRIKIGWDHQGKSIEKIKDGFLEAFTSQGYNLTYADVWADCMTVGSHENKGEERTTGLYFNHANKDFLVELGDRTDEESIKKMAAWFDSLHKKYQEGIF